MYPIVVKTNTFCIEPLVLLILIKNFLILAIPHLAILSRAEDGLRLPFRVFCSCEERMTDRQRLSLTDISHWRMGKVLTFATNGEPLLKEHQRLSCERPAFILTDLFDLNCFFFP